MKTVLSSSQTKYVDVKSLESSLANTVKGEVRFDRGSRGLYSTDASNYRQVPIGVVIPRDEEDIVKAVSLCHQFGAPLLTRGGGTSLAGQCCNVAVVLDLSKYYNRVLDYNKDKKLIKIQTGIVLDEMNNHVADDQLIFGPDPATHTHCTIGGMLGNNSCGVHSVMAVNAGNGARMEDNVESLTILTYDGCKMEVGAISQKELNEKVTQDNREGQIYRQLADLSKVYEQSIRTGFPDIPRRVSGYNLPELLPENHTNLARALVGTEGTCVVILDATLKLIHSPNYRSLVLLGFPDIYEAGHMVPKIMSFKPIGLEGIDDRLVEFMKKKHLHTDDLKFLPDGKGWLLVEFGGKNKDEADKLAKRMMSDLKEIDNSPDMRLYDKHSKESRIWEIRESGLGATAWVPGEKASFPGWEDSAVAPAKIGDYLKALRQLFDKYDYHPALYGHFGQGCVHCRVEFNLFSEEGQQKYRRFSKEAAALVVSFGGSLSGEHGDGQSRGELLSYMYSDDLMQAFRDFKAIWDPDWRMNPGKIIDTYGQLTNIRVGKDYNPGKSQTYFHYPDDNDNFAHAALRCVGVGKCRRHDEGVMCPSYMVTREEKHSTRGRARLLFEMLQNEVIEKKWKSEEVKEALDLCLACKGCKSDCPVNVDMATYKAEFLAHYYKGRLRPRSAYAFGFINRWASLAMIAPRVANWISHFPGISQAVKWAGGVDPHRTLPEFALKSFRKQFRKHADDQNEDQKKVILWADTFNNYFKTETLAAAEKVLKEAGFSVIVPKEKLCCGRPLYDFGLLTEARRLLVSILDTLRDEIDKGTPIVGIEPSCVAVFRDELCQMLPDREDAKKLKQQTFTLAEFLLKYTSIPFPKLNRKAIVHIHCHHHAIMGESAELEVLEKLGVDFENLDAGCCGMAGYFGYIEGENYEVSMKAGERKLLPKVREVASDTLIIADGFSCKEQIEQATNRKALHLAEVIALAIEQPEYSDIKQ